METFLLMMSSVKLVDLMENRTHSDRLSQLCCNIRIALLHSYVKYYDQASAIAFCKLTVRDILLCNFRQIDEIFANFQSTYAPDETLQLGQVEISAQ